MTIKIGVNPLSWKNRDFPHIGEMPTDKILDEIALIGYQGFEFEPFLEDDALAEKVLAREIICLGGWHDTLVLENGMDQEIERLKQHINHLKPLGAEMINLAEVSRSVHRKSEVSLSQRPKLHDDEWGKLCEGLDTLAKVVEEEGLRSSYHHHMGTVVQDAKDIDTLMQKTETLGLLFDVGHLVYAELDPMDILEKHINRITHVHCKNVRRSTLNEKIENDTSFLSAVIDGSFTVPGDFLEGSIDFTPIIRKLIDHDYKGWLVMEAEQDPNIAHPYTYAQLGYVTLNFIVDQLINRKCSDHSPL